MDLISDVKEADEIKMLEWLKVKLPLLCCEGEMRSVPMTRKQTRKAK